MTAADQLKPIPHPPTMPFVGNIFDLDSQHPVDSLIKLAREYGPIYRITTPGSHLTIVSGYEIAAELIDETRFEKGFGPGQLAIQRTTFGGGLFTVANGDPRWSRAHAILLPAFGMDAIRGYHPMMVDIALQLAQKWERLNPDDTVDVAADMTRLTLDTIALCGFRYRFNSFYRDTLHPFVAAMLRGLERRQAANRALPIQQRLDRKSHREAEQDEASMIGTVRRLIDERRASGETGKVGDLLDRMLTGVDRQTGERLDDENIIAQCVTFLVAGHETTSGLLSFAIYALLKNPTVLARAYDEVDRVLGTDLSVLPTYAQVRQLGYIDRILRETLRLWPTAPAFSRHALQDAVIGGAYAVTKEDVLSVLLAMLHRDPAIWGQDAERFEPDNFLPVNQEKRPPGSYLPFGSGKRACIGRLFAIQEATLVLGMLLQRFELIDHTGYELVTRQALTIKPADFHIKVRTRPGRTATMVATAPLPEAAAEPQAAPAAVPVSGHHTPLLILYGSNLGTAEGIAHEIAQDAAARGFVTTVGALDEHVGQLPTDGAVVIVTASYNGTPPDNAARFCDWLQESSLTADAFAGVRYTVFGCGNRDWAATYQAIPKLIDAELERHGAQRLYGRGEGDARSDFDGDYRAWYGPLWQVVSDRLDLPTTVAEDQPTGPRFSLTFIDKQAANPITTSFSAVPMTVKVHRELQNHDGDRPSPRSTSHVEVTLPPGLTYEAGDHLGIVPRNGVRQIQRVVDRFKLDAGVYLTITPDAGVKLSSSLPVNEPVPLVDLLANRVELQDVATRSQVGVLASFAADPAERAALDGLSGDDETSEARYKEQVLATRTSVLDLLEEHPSVQLPFEVFLDMLPPLRPRYYSISSSPLVDAESCSITVGLVEGPARSGRGTYSGVCSSYLRRRPDDTRVFGFIRKPTIAFKPPEDPRQPMIMVGPGTGIAPFRGFLQDRAGMKRKGVTVGESLLFFGCRDPLQDFIYADELRAFEGEGVTRLFTAFSREPGQPKRYVQDAIEEQATEVWRLLQDQATIYVCGDASRMAPDVRRAFGAVFQGQTGASDADAQVWLTGLTASGRYLEDIWPSGN